ncbi:LOW QUALITY PROTEIN: hypothetical protein HID58_002975 [Brassica napus]|uniref:Uncharacterized protein n=1 Tax=Brassica napus TaxID=3708 RepID=A0ABQ8EPD0_BRANA|nr:LOW QUALITY PROTEIN: hypothetical protein HID58_002975 [Brassica napus]
MRAVFDPMERSDLMWGENELMAQEICLILTNSLTQILAFVSCLILESLIQHVGKRSTWIDPSSLECLLSATVNSINTSTEHNDRTKR